MNDEHVVVSSNAQSDVEITEKDVARLLHSIAYRKAYNQREGVRARRKEYGRKRNARMRLVAEWIKRNPEQGGVA